MTDPVRPMGVTPMSEDLDLPDPRVPLVQKVVQEHLADSVWLNAKCFSREPRSLIWAERLTTAEREAEQRFDRSNDLKQLEDLRRHAIAMTFAINGLPPSLQRKLELAKTGVLDRKNPSKEPHRYTPIIELLLDDLGRFQKVLDRLLESPSTQNVARRNRNWRAAAVAEEARRVWAEAKWDGPDIYSDFDALRVFREKRSSLAPKHEKRDAPGPFGRFLVDVNRVLEIFGQDGQPVAAATALESLISARKK